PAMASDPYKDEVPPVTTSTRDSNAEGKARISRAPDRLLLTGRAPSSKTRLRLRPSPRRLTNPRPANWPNSTPPVPSLAALRIWGRRASKSASVSGGRSVKSSELSTVLGVGASYPSRRTREAVTVTTSRDGSAEGDAAIDKDGSR